MNNAYGRGGIGGMPSMAQGNPNLPAQAFGNPQMPPQAQGGPPSYIADVMAASAAAPAAVAPPQMSPQMPAQAQGGPPGFLRGHQFNQQYGMPYGQARKMFYNQNPTMNPMNRMDLASNPQFASFLAQYQGKPWGSWK